MFLHASLNYQYKKNSQRGEYLKFLFNKTLLRFSNVKGFFAYLDFIRKESLNNQFIINIVILLIYNS